MIHTSIGEPEIPMVDKTSTVLSLQRNVQFLYEEHIARIELASLGCTDYTRDASDWTQISARVNGEASAIHWRSAYVGALGTQPTIYSQLIRPKYQGGRFNRTRSVNQYLTHWIYPYQGKFHPQMVRALLNIVGAQRGDLVWEPFLGSGTAAVECSLLGIDCVGTDLSPLCVVLTRVKTQAYQEVDAIRTRVAALLKRTDLHPDTLQTSREKNPMVRDFLEVARMVTYSDASRRARDAGPWLRKNLVAMLESVEAHALAVTEFGLTPGAVTVRVGDARDPETAGLKPSSVDHVLTSPPYSIALDYVKNDEHALDALGVDTQTLRRTMTGVRGRGAAEKLSLYNNDMQQMFHQVAWALKPGGTATFVIGDATVDGSEVTTVDTMASWAEAVGLRREHRIKKIVYGLYSIMKDEWILVFRKP
jgi:tRNA G10  N-methylase Trm11